MNLVSNATPAPRVRAPHRCERVGCSGEVAARLVRSDGPPVWICMNCALEVEREKRTAHA